MYEKPQYFTPDGFKRLPKNPYSAMNASQRLELLKKKKLAALPDHQRKKTTGITLSDEAAARIANVLKVMLNSRR